MRRILHLAALTALIFNLTQAQYSYDMLRIQHPQQTWRSGTGTVDQALVSVTPKALSFEYGLYLTFSGKGLGFTAADSVEIQLEFALPKDAVVNDLWLWMDDNTIMKGVLLDKWTASSIYENIVKRRRDPALLMKTSATRYSLRIYPMVGNKSRKIKITYLVPMDPAKGLMTAAIPFSIPKLSANPVKMTVFYWPNTEYPSARFGEIENGFESNPRVDASTQQPFFYGEAAPAQVSADLTLQASPAAAQSLRIKTFRPTSSQQDGYYQLMFTPASLFNINTSVKTAFLFELDETRTTLSTLSYVTAVKSFIKNNYTAKDSFALIFSSDRIWRVARPGWYGADSASVEQAFNNVTISMMQTGNNLTGLIIDGLSFVREQGGTGTLWLIAGTDKLSQLDPANAALSSIMKANTSATPIYITDLVTRNYPYTYINNKYYYGDEYLFENLAKMTRATYQQTLRLYNSTLTSLMTETLLDARGKITSFDVLTRLDNGFCTNRVTNLSLTGGELPLSATVNQVGKYVGQFPFILELAGMYKGSTLTKKIVVTDAPDLVADSTVAVVWAGRQIGQLEDLPVTNTLTKSIVDLSLQYNVLSKYTAFLALEPNDTLRPCSGCKDETKLLSVANRKPVLVPKNDSLLFSYPNPFNGATVLKIRLPQGVTAKETRLQIFNTLGQLVRTFDVSGLSADRFTEVRWDGADDRGKTLTSGMYFAVLTTPLRNFAHRLMYLK